LLFRGAKPRKGVSTNMATATTTTTAARTLALSLIRPSKDNPRTTVEKEPLAELAASIKEKGILEPIMVRPDGKEFEIVFGERRFRAAKLAGLKDVPVIVRADLSDADAAEIRLMENMQRVDLQPLDEAAGFAKLQAEQKYTVPEICAKVGKKPSLVYARLALLNLPDVAKEALRTGAVTEAVALVIARIPNAKQREKAASEILRGKAEPLSLNQARAYVRARFMLALGKAPFDPADA
jgi:ParB family transcriptional regulator, chromosome partitioning protein